MLLNLIACDPGGESGVAAVTFNPLREAPAHETLLRQKSFDWYDNFQIQGTHKQQAYGFCVYVADRTAKAARAAAQRNLGDVRTVVIMEDFTPPRGVRTKDVLSPVKIAAMVDYHLWWLNQHVPTGTELVWQQPNERNVITDDNLRQWNLWLPGKKNDDAMAALKHLVVYMRKLEEA